MKISFSSNQNHFVTDDPLAGFKEFEDLTYSCQILPNNGSHTLHFTSINATTDPNRMFLIKQYRLEEAATPGNTVAFWIYDEDNCIGKLFFNYYHDAEIKTHSVCIETNIFNNIPGMVLIVFKRIHNFLLTL